MLALNGADQLNGPRQWGSLLFCLVIVLSLQRAEGSTEETGSSYTKIRILPRRPECGSRRDPVAASDRSTPPARHRCTGRTSGRRSRAECRVSPGCIAPAVGIARPAG